MPQKKRTAVITGATGELGSSLARDLAAQGMNLALLARSPARLDELARGLRLPGESLFTRAVDLLDPRQAASAAEETAAHFGGIDILIHLVGGWTGGKNLVEAQRADLQSMIDQHIWSSFNAVQVFTPHLVKNGWGRLVMISSPSAARPSPRGGLYAIAKAGQEALVMTLAQELKGTGVTANLLLVKMIDVRREKTTAPSLENAAWTTPEELSAAILFLVSEEGGAINGARLPLFGG